MPEVGARGLWAVLQEPGWIPDGKCVSRVPLSLAGPGAVSAPAVKQLTPLQFPRFSHLLLVRPRAALPDPSLPWPLATSCKCPSGRPQSAPGRGPGTHPAASPRAERASLLAQSPLGGPAPTQPTLEGAALDRRVCRPLPRHQSPLSQRPRHSKTESPCRLC